MSGSRRKAIVALSVMAVFMAAPAPAAQAPLGSGGVTLETSPQHASGARITAFEQATFTLDDIISKVEGTQGGLVIAASFEIVAGKPVYRVRTLQSWNHAVWDGMIDARTGKLAGKGRTTPVAQLDAQTQSMLARLDDSYLTLAEVVVTAEDRDGGKAMSASLSEAMGELRFRVVVLTGEALKTMVVDAQTGNVVSLT